MGQRLAVVGLLLLFSSLAARAWADPVYGCQNNSNGRISKLGSQVPKCGKKQTPISWDTSSSLPPKLFTDGILATDQLLCNQTVCETTLVTLTLDPGTYLLVGNLTLAGDGNLAFCYLHPGPELIPNVTPAPFATAAAQPQLGGYVPMTLQAPFTAGVSSQVSLSCAANGTATHGQNWRLSAVAVREMN